MLRCLRSAPAKILHRSCSIVEPTNCAIQPQRSWPTQTRLFVSLGSKGVAMAPKRQRTTASGSIATDTAVQSAPDTGGRATRRKVSTTADATTKKESAVTSSKESSKTQANAKKSACTSKKAGNGPSLKSEQTKESPSSHSNNETASAAGADGRNELESLSAPLPRSKTNYEAPDGIPRNMTIPDPLMLDNVPKPAGSTRIVSWNIVSLKSSLGKGLLRYIEAEDADVVFLTETKCNDVPMIPALTARYPHQTWGIGKTKGYAGVAFLSKVKPIKIFSGIPNDSAGDDTKGRLITAEFERYIVCGTYVVNAGEQLKSLDAKVRWNEAFAAHLASCDARKPTIWTGDLNVVLDARDLSKASEKWNKSPGYSAVECNHHRRVLAGTAVPGAQPYVDVWRERNPDAVGHFTFYGFRGMCRSKGIGWRLDSFIIPKRMLDEVIHVDIRHTVYGASDHVPIYMDIKGTL